jgi:hypothetical protein
MLDQLFYLCGVATIAYVVGSGIVRSLLWTLVRLDELLCAPLRRAMERAAPQRTDTKAASVRGYVALWSLVGLVGLVLQLTVGLH